MFRVRQFMSLVALTAALGLGAAACGKKPPEVVAVPPAPTPPPPAAPANPPPPPPPPAPAPAPSTPAPATLTEEQLFARKTLDQLNQERPLADVFFELDGSDLREDARPVLQKNADWMKKWASTQVIVEGHADARGTAEYNLALGTRRADRKSVV